MSLRSFLTCPVDVDLPPNVFVNEKLQSKADGAKVYDSAASKWLQVIFPDEDMRGTVLEEYKNHVVDNPPETFSLLEIEDEYTMLRAPEGGSCNFTIVQGLDALQLPASPMAKNSIIQVASQFNGLEGMHPDRHTPLEMYPNDRTQGPRVVMPCAHALLKREALYANGMPFNAFSKMLPQSSIEFLGLRHGYLQWGKRPEVATNLLFPKQNFENVGKLLLMPMWCRPELVAKQNHLVIQVPTAAPPTNAYGNSGTNETQQTIAHLLVGSQYRALAQMAAIKSVATKRQVALHLTFLGQGVFHNDAEVFMSAIEEVCDALQGFNVRVFLHAYGLKDVSLGQQAFKRAGVEYENMTSAEFLQTYPPKYPRRVRRSSQSCPKQSCGLWDEVVDTVAPYIVNEYKSRCVTSD